LKQEGTEEPCQTGHFGTHRFTGFGHPGNGIQPMSYRSGLLRKAGSEAGPGGSLFRLLFCQERLHIDR
jgi:hypothetical protein